MTVVESLALCLLTKRCTACRQSKPWREFYAAKKWPDGTMRVPQSRCKKCAHAIRHMQRKQPTQWTRHLAQQRARYRRMSPEMRAIKREGDRTRKRRLAAISPHRWRVDVPTISSHRSASPLLPLWPFSSWLATLGPSPTAIGLETGLSRDAVNRYLKATVVGTVSLDVVDRACLRAGANINDLYPLDMEEAA